MQNPTKIPLKDRLTNPYWLATLGVALLMWTVIIGTSCFALGICR